MGILGTFSFSFAPLSFSLFLSLSFLMILMIDPRASWMQTDYYWVTAPAAPLVFLSLLLYLCLSTMLKRSSEGKYICIAPDFRGNAFSFPHFVLCLTKGFFGFIICPKLVYLLGSGLWYDMPELLQVYKFYSWPEAGLSFSVHSIARAELLQLVSIWSQSFHNCLLGLCLTFRQFRIIGLKIFPSLCP